MHVINRKNQSVPVRFDKITDRNKELTKDLSGINIEVLSQKTINSIKDGMTTSEIDQEASGIAMLMSQYNQDYAILASRIIVSDLHKSTSEDFAETLDKLKYNDLNYSLITEEYYEKAMKHIEQIQKTLDYSRDYNLSYFGIQTLKGTYLLKTPKGVIERPQHMYMRVALTIRDNINEALQCYEEMSLGRYTPATPTLYNAGTTCGQYASCFLLNMEDDLKDIYETLLKCAMISKNTGGIGINLTKIRSNGAIIKGVNGKGDGIVPLVQVYNSTSKYVNQGSKRNGSIAFYLEPWHADIQSFIRLVGKNTPSDQAASSIFIALWTCDLFMKRVQAREKWSLFCPMDVPKLYSTFGDEFEAVYHAAEDKKLYKKQIDAMDLWIMIMKSQKETGLPYMLYKDAINRKNNQSNVGMINCSNLCAEIVEFTDSKNVAVCNLHSIALPSFIKLISRSQAFVGQKLDQFCILNERDGITVVPAELCVTVGGNGQQINEGKENITLGATDIKDGEEMLSTFQSNNNGLKFDFVELGRIVGLVVENLNFLIDKNKYPIADAASSNLYLRPIGIGVQGLADVFARFKCSWDSKLAKLLNRRIFETIYFYAVNKSAELAEKTSRPYQAFAGSPISKGLLQCDLWEREAKQLQDPIKTPSSPLDFDNWGFQPISPYGWDELRNRVKNGVRNSLLVALMPTASTAHILGNNECFEPFTKNIYVRRTNAGSFFVLNKHFYKEMQALNLSPEILKEIMVKEGNIQDIKEIPQNIRDVFKTVWDIKQKTIIDLAADRAPYIDQTQSMNIHLEDPTISQLTSMHFSGWKRRLKTGSYYVRTEPVVEPDKPLINNEPIISTSVKELCVRREGCISCSS